MFVISTKLYLVEIGSVHQTLQIFKCTMLKTLNSGYQPAKFHWPGLSGSNFTRACGKHPPPPQTYMLSKSPVLIGLRNRIIRGDYHEDQCFLRQNRRRSGSYQILSSCQQHKTEKSKPSGNRVSRNIAIPISNILWLQMLSRNTKYLANDDNGRKNQ